MGMNCGLGSGMGDCLSKGSGLWGIAKTTNIFCAFQLCQGQALTPSASEHQGYLAMRDGQTVLGRTCTFFMQVVAGFHLETSAPRAEVPGLVSLKHAPMQKYLCVCVCV